jgi:hypothetical protein
MLCLRQYPLSLSLSRLTERQGSLPTNATGQACRHIDQPSLTTNPSTKHLKHLLPPNIPTTKTSINPHIPFPNNPPLRLRTPITQIPAHERESHSLRFSRLKQNFLKPAKDFNGTHVLVGGLWET